MSVIVPSTAVVRFSLMFGEKSQMGEGRRVERGGLNCSANSLKDKNKTAPDSRSPPDFPGCSHRFDGFPLLRVAELEYFCFIFSSCFTAWWFTRTPHRFCITGWRLRSTKESGMDWKLDVIGVGCEPVQSNERRRKCPFPPVWLLIHPPWQTNKYIVNFPYYVKVF